MTGLQKNHTDSPTKTAPFTKTKAVIGFGLVAGLIVAMSLHDHKGGHGDTGAVKLDDVISTKVSRELELKQAIKSFVNKQEEPTPGSDVHKGSLREHTRHRATAAEKKRRDIRRLQKTISKNSRSNKAGKANTSKAEKKTGKSEKDTSKASKAQPTKSPTQEIPPGPTNNVSYRKPQTGLS